MFDINAVIKEYAIDTTDLANILFPNAKYKKPALDRVLKYECTIDVDQLCRLAEYLGVSVDDLFKNETWKGNRKDGYFTLTKGEYRVILFKDGYYYSLYKGETLIDRMVNDLQTMTMGTFLTNINNTINNYENEQLLSRNQSSD